MATTYAQQPFSWRGFETRQLPKVPSWIEPLGRAGFAAKGIVYGVIGFLAFKLAIGADGEIAGSREAITEIGQQSYGKTMLGVMAVSLIGYTAWRFVQSVKDTEGNGSGAKGIVKRVGYAISGVGYLLLACFAGSFALGFGSSDSGGGGVQSTLLESITGRAILVAVGAVTMGVACYLVYTGIQAKFLEKYSLGSMNETQRTIALHAGRMGLTTRGIAFAIIGGFILLSAIRGTSYGEIAGMGDALAAIAAQSYGKILLGVTGFGLMCYSVHMVMMSIFRRFNLSG